MNLDFIIDLHTHTFWSDGILSPAELVQQALARNYRVIAITDHADSSNLKMYLSEITKFASRVNSLQNDIVVLPGVELTHIFPSEYKELVEYSRALGAKVVVAHGETPVEPVPEGTNRAAVEAGVDILAHPGLIDESVVELAAKNGVMLEITARRGGCYANGRVAKLGLEKDAKLVFNTDAHTDEDLATPDRIKTVLLGSGLTLEQAQRVIQNSVDFARRIGVRI